MLAAGCAMILAATALGQRWALSSLLVFVIFGLSLSLRTRQPGDTGLDFQNGMKLLTWVLIPLIGIVNWHRLVPFLRERTIVLAALYGMIAFASSLWSLTPAYTAGNALGIIAYLILACLAVSIIGIPATLRLFTITLLFYVSLALAAGVLMPETAWVAPSVVETTYRLQGFSGHPNVLGEQTAVLVTFAAIAHRRKVIGWKILIASVVVGFAALIATDSRTTTAAALAAWVIIALRERRLLLPGAAIALCGGVVAAGLLAVDGFPNIGHLLGPLSRSGSASEITTLTGRTELWAVAADLIAQKPLFGWGFNGTEALMVGSVGRAFVGDPVNAHNMYIQTLLSMGFLGSLPAFGFLGILAVRMVVRPDPTRDQIVLLAMIIGLAEVGLFSTPVLLPLAFFFVLASEVAPFLEGTTTTDIVSSFGETSQS
jgi:O-antigen ligase